MECSLIGFVQPGAAAAAAQGAADGDVAEASGAAAAAAAAGKDSSSSSVQLHAAFAPLTGKAKAVLSVGVAKDVSWGLVRNIPMYF
jgi:hypothetical protein